MTGSQRPRRVLAGAGWLVRTSLLFGVFMLLHGLTLHAWSTQRLDRAVSEREHLRREISQAEVVASKLAVFLEDLRLLGGRLEQVAARLPEERTAWLPSQLTSRAEEAAVEIVRPSQRARDAVEGRDFVKSTPLLVEGRGSLPALGRFADGLWRLSALNVEAVEIAKADSGTYTARFEIRAWEWLPDAHSAPPHCERSEPSLYAAAELVAAGRRVASRLDEGDGWRRRRVTYRVIRIFKPGPGTGVPEASWPGRSATIPVVRDCLTTRAPSATATWPAPIEYCPDSAPTLAQGSNGTDEDRPAAGERLLFLRSSGAGSWEPVGRYGIFGSCDAPLPAEQEAGYRELRAWRGARDVSREPRAAAAR